jgi:hypothetical protein
MELFLRRKFRPRRTPSLGRDFGQAFESRQVSVSLGESKGAIDALDGINQDASVISAGTRTSLIF